MSKKDPRKLAKKREAQRKRLRESSASLAYRGAKYKTPALAPFLFETERGIYEAFVMSFRKMTDHEVRADLENLIRGIRNGSIRVSEPEAKEESREVSASLEELTVVMIRRHWDDYLRQKPSPGRDNVIGVLRTILGSIEVWGTINPESRGYLRFLEGFLNKLGVHVEVTREPPADLPLPANTPAAPQSGPREGGYGGV